MHYAYAPLKMMIEDTLEMQLKTKQSHPQMVDTSKSSWLNEFCTVRFTVARQCGHTSAAMKLALEMFQSSIYIGYREDYVYSAFKSLEPNLLKKDSYNLTRQHAQLNENICTFADRANFDIQLRGRKPNAIFVEPVSCFSSAIINQIQEYAVCVAQPCEPFILCLLQ